MTNISTNREGITPRKPTIPERMVREVADLLELLKSDATNLENSIMRRRQKIEGLQEEQEVDKRNLIRVKGAMGCIKSIETKQRIMVKEYMDAERVGVLKEEQEVKVTPTPKRRRSARKGKK